MLCKVLELARRDIPEKLVRYETGLRHENELIDDIAL